jgi:hypothetical protein
VGVRSAAGAEAEAARRYHAKCESSLRPLKSAITFPPRAAAALRAVALALFSRVTRRCRFHLLLHPCSIRPQSP